MKFLRYLLLLTLAIGGYFILIEIIFIDRRLIEIKGQLLKKHVFTKTETIYSKPVDYNYLTFMLKEQPHFFILKLKIDSVGKEQNIFDGVSKSIEKANEISAWIEKTDKLYEVRPRVYRVVADGEIVFERLKKPINEYILYLILFGITIAFIGVNYLFNSTKT